MSSGWNWMSGLMSPITAPGWIFGAAVTVPSENVAGLEPGVSSTGAGAAAAWSAPVVSRAVAQTLAHRRARPERGLGLKITRRPIRSRRDPENRLGPPTISPDAPACDVAGQRVQMRAPLLRRDDPAVWRPSRLKYQR